MSGETTSLSARQAWWLRTTFVVGTLAALVGLCSSDSVLAALGISNVDRWFLDSHSILSAIDAQRAGIPPDQPNPLDAFGRPHAYSDWWLALGWLGLDRSHNFGFGLSWVASFLLAAFLLLRPANARQALMAFIALCSPPVLLAIQRANNDLIIFVLLAIAGWLLQLERPRWWGASALSVMLATGLKFYPATAAASFLLVHPAKRRWTLVLLGGAAVGLVLWSVADTMHRGQFILPLDVHKFGAAIIVRDLGGSASIAPWLGIAVLGATGIVLTLVRLTTGLAAPPENPGPRSWFVIGAAVLVGCFLSGISHGYRWIFLLLLLPWLWNAPNPFARGFAWAAVLMPWFDGVFCLVINTGIYPVAAEELDATLRTWRLWVQPLSWLFMAALTGWLCELGFARLRGRELAATNHPA